MMNGLTDIVDSFFNRLSRKQEPPHGWEFEE